MTSSAQAGGPFVRAAFLCDMLIEGKDGVFSYLRIIDRYQVQLARFPSPPPPTVESPSDQLPPDSLPETTIQGWLVLGFVAGRTRGRKALKVRIETPDGLLHDMLGPVDLNFDGRPNHANNVHMRLSMTVKEEGLHWFRAYLDDQEQTRVPLDVQYQRS